MASSQRRAGRPGERGAITWVTLLLLALVVSAGYLTSVWFPVYFVDYEVKQVVRDYGNQAVKNPDDSTLLANMCQKLRSLTTVEALGENGQVERRPAVDLQPQDVIWERDTQANPPVLRVAFEYRRDVHYPVFDRWVEKRMQIDLAMDIGRADWGPSR
jgi:hypothetical protein